MTDYDDHILQAFIEESQEHLDGIENDLLRIEAAGAEIDDDLVNEVFRAVHSIKGGSSFLGLENITELAHAMESVLNMVRNRQLVLDGTGTSVLLAAADVLVGMLADTGSSNERDIGAELEALRAIPDGGSPAAQSPTPSPVATEPVATPTPEPTPEPTAGLPVSVDEAALDEALEMLDYLYLVEYGADEIDEGVLAELEELGTVLSQVAQGVSLFVLFATVADVDVVASLLGLEEAQVRLLEPDQVRAASPVDAVDALAQTPVLPAANGEDLGPEGMLAMDAAVGPAPEVMRFLDLTHDLLNQIDQAFEVLLRKPDDVDALASLFDAVHRIKIAVGEQGLTDLYRLLGVGEDLLNRLRTRGFGVEAATIEILLDMASLTGEVCSELESDSLPEERDITALVDQLLELAPESEPEQHHNGQADANPPVANPPAKKTTAVKSPIVETNLRVHVRLLDRLMNLAGELVLTRNQLKQVVALGDGAAVERTTQRLDQVTTELQETVVSTRMQPVGNVFGKFRRIVRDIARDLNKDVELVLEGEEVELDKTIIEALSDPLTHLVRNALDHGIETPSVRYEQGKQPTATLLLRALHEAGQVIIEVTDSGAGIDPEKIRAKALSTGNYDASQLNSMGDRDLVRLIFHPGFSTAEEVTDISGRGVGMDVVLTNLTKLGGIVDIDSEVGRGTTVRVKLPLTLAIIPALLVGMGSERFAVPQVNLAELVRVPMRRRQELVQELGNAQVLRLRGNLLPLISLRQVFSDEIVDEEHLGALNVLVLKAGDFRYGMIVDELFDSEEIVVKPLDDFLSNSKIYVGATILGDGQVAMILDVIGISDIKDLEAMEGASAEIEEDIDDLGSDVQELLLVHNHPEEQFAIPVSLVSRIERIHCNQIERTGTRASMQYLGGHLILFSLEDAAAVSSRPETDYLYVLVFTVADHEVGLLVSELVDITSQAVDVSVEGFVQAGIMGSTTISGRTTLMVDLYDLVRRLEPTWIEEHNARYSAESERTILIAEDTAFFRNQLERFVVEAGYRALVVEDGAKALAELERRGDEIDLILTDIEMPEIDGLELARRVRSEPRFAQLPIIAVTSLGGEDNERRGRDAGVDDYLIKIDREQILQTIRHRLGAGSLAL